MKFVLGAATILCCIDIACSFLQQFSAIFTRRYNDAKREYKKTRDVTLLKPLNQSLSTTQRFQEATQIRFSKNASTVFFFLMNVFLLILLPIQVIGQDETRRQEITQLSSELQNGTENVQKQAVSKLGEMGKDAVPALIQGLKTIKNPEVLSIITKALETIGKDAVHDLIIILKAETLTTKDPIVLRYTSNTLKNIAKKSKYDTAEFKEAVPSLMEILKNKKSFEAKGDSNYNLQDFDAAADCLGYLGREAKDAVSLLIELIKNEKYRKEPHFRKADSVIAILDNLVYRQDFSANEEIVQSFDKYKSEIDEEDRSRIESKIELLKRTKEHQDYKRFSFMESIFREYPSLIWLGILISIVLIAWLSIFAFKPLWLLKLYEGLSTSEGRLSAVLGIVTFPIQSLLASCVFRPRVLDAWVKRHLSAARQSFSNKQTVKDRRIHVPVGLFLNDKFVSEFTPQDLQDTFARNQSRLLISGVGGAGKTSLACQIANWAMEQEKDQRLYSKHSMIPVLLEQDFVERVEDALMKTVSAQLSDAIDAHRPISKAMLQALLEKKRVLVLVDGMSEMNEMTQTAILSGITKIPINAVVFTSRSDETIRDLSKTVIKTANIKGNQLSSFVETYLMSLGRKDLFEDEEFFEGCRLLSTIFNGRDITALLAKLFVEQMVAKQEKTIDEDLPKSIPELMLQSIKVLYKKTPSDALALRDVLKSAKIIAWESLKKDYRPLPADYEETKKSLAGLPNGEKSLNYLKDKLKLVETTSFDEKIRFKIDPLAEYLAGMYLVENYKYDKDKWSKFFDTTLSKTGSLENIKGFLLAVRDCCMRKDIKNEVPSFVVDKLTKMAVLESPEPVKTLTTPVKASDEIINVTSLF